MDYFGVICFVYKYVYFISGCFVLGFFYDVFINIIEGSVKMCISSICLYWLMLYILYILCVFILDLV